MIELKMQKRFIYSILGASSLLNSITNDDKEQEVVNEKRDKLLAKADQGDLIKFGIIPELTGRFPVVVPFHSFNKSMLIRVLTEVRRKHDRDIHFFMRCLAKEFLTFPNEDAILHVS